MLSSGSAYGRRWDDPARIVFLKLSPSVGTKVHTARTSALIPRPASSCVSLRKVKGPERMRLRSQSALASDKTCRVTGLRIPSQILPLRHAGGADLDRLGNRTNYFPRVSSRQSPFPDVFLIGSRHPCWSPLSSINLNQNSCPRDPDSIEKQHASLAAAANRPCKCASEARLISPAPWGNDKA